MIKGLTYAIVTTGDVPRARRFFTEKRGLSPKMTWATSSASSRRARERSGG